jgi:hypothetical protein
MKKRPAGISYIPAEKAPTIMAFVKFTQLLYYTTCSGKGKGGGKGSRRAAPGSKGSKGSKGGCALYRRKF